MARSLLLHRSPRARSDAAPGSAAVELQEGRKGADGRGGGSWLALLAGSVLVWAGCAEPADTPRPGDPQAVPEAVAPGLPGGVQATSLLGESLYPPSLPADLQESREAELAAAEAQRGAEPDDPDAWIWVGRRQAYLGRYREAIRTFSEALEHFPHDPTLLRHRGHRWITVREFERAVEDLSRGVDGATTQGSLDEVEPDGLPNPAGIPLGTLGFNLWYHLSLAEYLRGDFEAARRGWEATLDLSGNPDLQVAARYWLHLTLRQLGEETAAAQVVASVTPEMELLENHAYHDLILHFRGLRSRDAVLPEEGEGLGTVTVLYGLGAKALLDGDEEEARRRFHEILSRHDQWAAFGFLAAEAEVARRGW
jgi:tetratricopeptide (TPR) repeat protein